MEQGVIVAELYTVRWYTTSLEGVDKSLRKIADIGYTAIEPAHSHEDPMGEMDPVEVAKLINDNGLTVASVHFPWDYFLKDLGRVVEEMMAYDCQRPAISGTIRGKYANEDGLNQFLAELAPVTETLTQAGMVLSYHHPFQWFARVGDRLWFDLLCERTDPEALLFQVDTYWAQFCGANPVQWIRKLAGRQEAVHYKDMTVSREGQQRYAEAGEGNLDMAAIVNAAKESGIKWYVVEQDEFYGRDPFESLAISYRNLSSMGLS